MKKCLGLLLALVAIGSLAGEPEWITDFEKAKELAAKEKKVILANFTGSDWCGWCKKLDREVFSKSEFQNFATDKLVLLKLDFPRFKKQTADERASNEKLMQKYGVQGFPTIYVLDKNGENLLQTGYRPGGASSYVEHLTPYVK